MGTSMRPNCNTGIVSMLATPREEINLHSTFQYIILSSESILQMEGCHTELVFTWPEHTSQDCDHPLLELGLVPVCMSVSISQIWLSYLPEDVRSGIRAIIPLCLLRLCLLIPLFLFGIGESVPHVFEGDLIVGGRHRRWATCRQLQDLLFVGVFKETASGGGGVDKGKNRLKGIFFWGSRLFLRFLSMFRICQ
jgi:hypothetical protein